MVPNVGINLYGEQFGHLGKTNHNFGTYAIPSNIIALNELPKTKSGKILRRLLRDLINHNNLNEKDLSTINNINIIKDIKNKIKESHEK